MCDDRVVRVLSFSGANIVKYGSVWDFSCKANGFVGNGDVCRFGWIVLAENGSRVARREDIGLGAFCCIGWFVRFASPDVSKDLAFCQLCPRPLLV